MKNQKSLTNKGFSLVELIIVVAIMAILIGVLAPQYLRYVEKSRLQKDNTSMGELANVIKMASAEETIINELNTATGTIAFTFDSSGKLVTTTIAASAPLLLAEVQKAIDTNEVQMTSTTYGKSTYPTINVEVDTSTNIIKVTAVGWMDSPSATPTTAAAPKVF